MFVTLHTLCPYSTPWLKSPSRTRAVAHHSNCISGSFSSFCSRLRSVRSSPWGRGNAGSRRHAPPRSATFCGRYSSSRWIASHFSICFMNSKAGSLHLLGLCVAGSLLWPFDRLDCLWCRKCGADSLASLTKTYFALALRGLGLLIASEL